MPRAFGNKQINISWFRGYAGVLIPRAFGNKQNNIPWFRGYAGVLIPRAFGNKQINIPWFRGYAGVLIPRAFGNKQNNIPWFRGCAGVLIPRAFGNKHNNVPWFPGYAGLWEQSQQQLQHWGSHSPRKADHVSLWGKRATCTEHFIPTNTRSVFPIDKQQKYNVFIMYHAYYVRLSIKVVGSSRNERPKPWQEQRPGILLTTYKFSRLISKTCANTCKFGNHHTKVPETFPLLDIRNVGRNLLSVTLWAQRLNRQGTERVKFNRKKLFAVLHLAIRHYNLAYRIL